MFFIGYHARANTPDAILCHTWTDQVRGVWLNDQEVGEIGLNAAVCGSFGARVVLITGDRAAVQEAIDLLGPIESVVVKTASGRMSAECLPIEEMRTAIRHAAAHAMVRQVPPLIIARRSACAWNSPAPIRSIAPCAFPAHSASTASPSNGSATIW